MFRPPGLLDSELPQFANYDVENSLVTDVVLGLVAILIYGATRERFSLKVPKWPRKLLWWKANPTVVHCSELPQFARYDDIG